MLQLAEDEAVQNQKLCLMFIHFNDLNISYHKDLQILLYVIKVAQLSLS